MLPPSCARCGAPLPAVAVDPTHPEWCASCAARAAGTAIAPPTVPPRPGPGAYGPTASTMTPGGAGTGRVRMGDAALLGLAAAGLGGLLWWGVAVLTESELWHYGSALLGLVVGIGVMVGARRRGLGPSVLAVVLSAAAVPVAVYFIDRSLAIAAREDAGISSSIPLWDGFGTAEDVIRSWIEGDRAKAAGWLLAPLVALVVTLVWRRRPAGA